LKLNEPAAEAVTELDAGMEFPAPMVTMPSGVAVPVQPLPVKKK
jgi:hypothetical protein